MDKTKEKAASTTPTAFQNVQVQFNAKTLGKQALKVLSRLRRKSMTSIELYHDCEVIHPPARIRDLREAGYQIITHWDYDQFAGGELHKVGRYVLLAEPSSQPEVWQHIKEPLEQILGEIPEMRALEEQEKDLQNWRKALEKTNPKFAKQLILGRLRESGGIDAEGAAWLIQELNLAEI